MTSTPVALQDAKAKGQNQWQVAANNLASKVGDQDLAADDRRLFPECAQVQRCLYGRLQSKQFNRLNTGTELFPKPVDQYELLQREL